MLTPGTEDGMARAVRLVREDQTWRIVKWLRGCIGAHGAGLTSADDVADAMEREFGSDEREAGA